MIKNTMNQSEVIARQNEIIRQYTCKKYDCNKTFGHKYDLKRHQKVHEVMKHFNCEEPECGVVFLQPKNLQIHHQVQHCGERPFKCDYSRCNKNYKTSVHLKRHKINSHSSNKEVTCAVEGCGKTYCNKYVLKQHVGSAHTHSTGKIIKKRSDIEKRHKCNKPGCTAAFRRPYRLQNHQLTVHGGEKPYKCNYEECVKSYTNESHLKRHQSTAHKKEAEIMCSYCGRIFSSQHTLQKHIAVYHTKPGYPCEKRDKKFDPKSQLNIHNTEKHGKEAQYKSARCPRMFSSMKLYNKHLKKS